MLHAQVTMEVGRGLFRRSGLFLGNHFQGAYCLLLKFLAPLALTNVAIDISEQMLNRGLTNSVEAVDNLAAFGIAYTFIKLFTGVTSDLKHVGLVLVQSQKDVKKLLYIVFFIGISLLSIPLLIGFTPVGYFIINKMFDLNEEIGRKTRKCIAFLSLFPLLDGLAAIFIGVLLQYKRSGLVAVASFIDIIAQGLTVVVLLQTSLKGSNAVIIPIIATYVGTTLRLLFLAAVYYRIVHSRLTVVYHIFRSTTLTEGEDETEEIGEVTVTVKKVLLFWLPLAFVQFCQRISRPLCNIFVSRDRIDGFTRREAAKAVAALTVCYPIGHLPYGWLNVLRTLEPTFAKQTNNAPAIVSTRKIRIFNFFCFCFSMTIMIVLFIIPGVAPSILSNVSHIKESLIKECIPVLYFFAFFPFPVINRAACTSIIIKRHKTSFLYPTVIVRVVVILTALNVLPRLGVHGAVMGMASLISGFLSESIAVLFLTIFVVQREARIQQEADSQLDAEI